MSLQKWTRSTDQTGSDMDMIIDENNQTTPDYPIDSVSYRDEGVYTCSEGPADLLVVTLEIEGKYMQNVNN